MYEKSIKFKLEKKFFNKASYLDNLNIYSWLEIARKHFLMSVDIDIDSLANYGFYYADAETRVSIKENIRYSPKEVRVYVRLLKHSGVKSTFAYEICIDDVIIITATSTHNVLREDSDRAVRIDRYLPKWDQILKDVVNNEIVK